MTTFAVTYTSRLSVDTLRREIDRELQDAQVQNSVKPADIEIEYKGSGLDSDSVMLIVTFLTSGPAYDVWKEVILPKLKTRFGDDSIEPTDDDN